MIHLINFLLKILATIISVPASACLIVISIMFWDKKYIDIASVIQNEYIWNAKKK
jgi:hypothetical protein